MNAINAILTNLTDAAFSALQTWSPLLTLVAVSIAVGVLMAVVFRFTSNQRALRRDADQTRAQVLAIKLFKDDLGTMFASLGQLFRHTGWRLWHSLPPMLVMIVPFVLLLTQLARWYEFAPLEPGSRAIVELEIGEDHWARLRNVSLESDDGIVVETPGLRDEAHHAVYWRIRADTARPSELRWRQGEETIVKQVSVRQDCGALCAVDQRRAGPSWWDRVLHPGEAAFGEDSPVQGIVVHYPTRSTPVLGIDVPWWATFLIVSMLAAVLVRPLVKVQF